MKYALLSVLGLPWLVKSLTMGRRQLICAKGLIRLKLSWLMWQMCDSESPDTGLECQLCSLTVLVLTDLTLIWARPYWLHSYLTMIFSSDLLLFSVWCYCCIYIVCMKRLCTWTCFKSSFCMLVVLMSIGINQSKGYNWLHSVWFSRFWSPCFHSDILIKKILIVQ